MSKIVPSQAIHNASERLFSEAGFERQVFDPNVSHFIGIYFVFIHYYLFYYLRPTQNVNLPH